MFWKSTDGPTRQLLDNVTLQTLAHGEKTLMGRFTLKKGAVIPAHAHPHEQTGLMISGRLRFTLKGRSCEVGPGDSWCIPGDAEHAAVALEDSVIIEVFSPVRQDYLPGQHV